MRQQERVQGFVHGGFQACFGRQSRYGTGHPFDLQRPALTDARRTAQGLGLNGRALFLVADGAALPLPEEAFDLVVLSTGLEIARSSVDLAQRLGVELDNDRFIHADSFHPVGTSVPGIYAIGDVVGGALLAHKAYQEAKVAAGVIAGEPAAFDSMVPAVIYTDPEVAWVGLGEREAKDKGLNVVTGSFPFKASGRAMSLDATDGFVKAIADADSKQLVGVVAVGRGVSEFIGEATLALEMGAFLEDVALTIHPHPTMSEALQEAIEGALGQAVHMVNK